MERIIPAGVFCVGLGCLGWWGQANHADRMQEYVTEGASAAIEGTTRHPIETMVSGRDISVSGLAHSEAERDAVLASLADVDGHRVIIDEIDLVPVAETYFLEAVKDENGLVLNGVVPDHAQKMLIQDAFPAANIDGVTLAAGEPNQDWGRAATSTLMALDNLDSGQMRMEKDAVFVSGNAADKMVISNVNTQLAALPAGYSQNSEITSPQPTELSLTIDPVDGARIEGIAPEGFEVGEVARVLGLDKINGEVTEGAIGNSDAALAKIGSIAPYLDRFESVNLIVNNEKADLTGEAATGVETAMLSRSLKGAFGAGAINITQAKIVEPEGEKRDNVLTGETEALSNGFWLPVETFEPTQASCKEQTDGFLIETKINFVPNSIDLDADARAVVNKLAGIMLGCVNDANLTAEVSGHTDNQGSEDANLELSDARARSVVAALAERGIPLDKLVPLGLGEAQPVADNSTEDGRAANRRTEIRWINN